MGPLREPFRSRTSTPESCRARYFPDLNVKIAVGSTLYFGADDASGRPQLWEYGGSGNLILVTAGPAFSQYGADPTFLAATGSTLYFAAVDANGNRQLWQYGGSGSPTLVTAGPTFRQDGGAYPTYLTVVGSTLYFDAWDAHNHDQLWQYGGSGSPSVVTGVAFWQDGLYGPEPQSLTAVGSSLYFTAGAASGVGYLWQYRGSGTPTPITASAAFYEGGNPIVLGAFGSTLYFAAWDADGHTRLWQYGGSGSPTEIMPDVKFDTNQLGLMTVVGSTLYFTTSSATGQPYGQLWQYDGSGSPTLVTGSAFWTSPSVRELTPVGSMLYFLAIDANDDAQLWRYDGTDPPTPVTVDPNGPPDPGSLAAIGNSLYFIANDGAHGVEPWIIPGVSGTSAPAISEASSRTSIPLGTDTTLTFTISNANPSTDLSGIAFTDTLPAGLVVAASLDLTSTLGGTVTAVAGSNTISLSGGALAGGGSAIIMVDVTGTLAGLQTNPVTVTSTEGGTGNTASASVTVVAPPTLGAAFDPTVIVAGRTASLTFTITNPGANTVDLGGVAFTDTLPAGLTVADGSAIVGGGILNMSGGDLISLAGATVPVGGQLQFNVPVTGALAGDHTDVTSAVISSSGGTGQPASASLTVLATNLPPIAQDLTASTLENTPVTIDIAASASDPDGDLDAASVCVTTPPTHGSVTVDPATGAATYTPDADYYGSDTFNYAISDTGGLSAGATVNITVQYVNQPPTAVDDTADTLANHPVAINVLANDSDVEGDLDPMSLRVSSAPGHGSASVDPQTHLVTYTPMTGFVGTDTFTYTISDTAGSSASATVTENVHNHPPQAHDVSATLNGTRPVPIDVIANVTDAGGDIIPSSVQIVKPPTEGTAAVDPATGTVTYTPGPKFTGMDMFTYAVSDSLGSTGSAVVVVQGPVPQILPPFNALPESGPPSGHSTTSTVVTSNLPSGSTYGQDITLIAVVERNEQRRRHADGDGPIPDRRLQLRAPVALSGGAARISLATLPAGYHQIIAYYTSDNTTYANSDSTGNVFTQTVHPAPLTVVQSVERWDTTSSPLSSE